MRHLRGLDGACMLRLCLTCLHVLFLSLNSFLCFEFAFRPCMVVPVVSPTLSLALFTQVFLVRFSSPSQPSVGTELNSASEEGKVIEVSSCDGFNRLFLGAVFAVGFTLGVGCAVYVNPGLWSGSGPELRDSRYDETFGTPKIST